MQPEGVSALLPQQARHVYKISETFGCCTAAWDLPPPTASVRRGRPSLEVGRPFRAAALRRPFALSRAAD